MNWIGAEYMEPYLAICKRAAEDDNTFRNFKRDKAFTRILEHTNKLQGLEYLNNIPEGFLNNPKFFTNDKVGNPVLFRYGSLTASPTTLQYIYILSEIVIHIGDLTGKKIIEIGGGYGGQCKIIKDVFDCDYSIVDLPEVLLLQEKYLSKFGYAANFYNPNSYPIQSYDLVISNYSLSEITEPLRSEYIGNVCKRSKHGYITCNSKVDFPGIILPDIKYERKENYRIIW